MIVELTKEELDIIESWYASAAGESAVVFRCYKPEENERLNKLVLDLLDKLGLDLDRCHRYSLEG